MLGRKTEGGGMPKFKLVSGYFTWLSAFWDQPLTIMV